MRPACSAQCDQRAMLALAIRLAARSGCPFDGDGLHVDYDDPECPARLSDGVTPQGGAQACDQCVRDYLEEEVQPDLVVVVGGSCTHDDVFSAERGLSGRDRVELLERAVDLLAQEHCERTYCSGRRGIAEASASEPWTEQQWRDWALKTAEWQLRQVEERRSEDGQATPGPVEERCEIPSDEGWVLSVPSSVADDYKRAIEEAALVGVVEVAVVSAAREYAMLDEYLREGKRNEYDDTRMLSIARIAMGEIVHAFQRAQGRLPAGRYLKAWAEGLIAESSPRSA